MQNQNPVSPPPPPPPPSEQENNDKKVAILFAYCGAGYQGMQKNPGAKTIEGDLQEALYFSNALPQTHRGCPKRFEFARSARTDKGVSAVGQVVSGKFYVDSPGFVERLNNNLPNQFRVFGFKRVTASFSAKKSCDRRRYVYLLPVFALDPSSHRDRESVLASVGSRNELVKCLECSERGRKVEVQSGVSSNTWCALSEFDGKCENFAYLEGSDRGRKVVAATAVPGTGKLTGSEVEIQSGISSNTWCALSEFDGKLENFTYLEGSDRGRKVAAAMAVPGTGKINGSDVEIQSGISSNTLCALSGIDGKHENFAYLEGSDRGGKVVGAEAVPGTGKITGSEVEVQTGVSSNTLSALSELVNKQENLRLLDKGNGCDNNPSFDAVKGNVFGYGDKEKHRFNKILKQYEGTHNFHNFTTRAKATDPSANRCIISFHANSTVTVGGIEFVKCEVVGQSFMLHQIRKMIGVAVAIMRNCAPESLIETALQQDIKINVPTAPEVGLYLDECFFSNYNQKWKDTHEEVSMKDYVKETEEFKLKHIYPHIASTEYKEGVVAVWLHSLNYRNYPDLCPKESSGANEVSGTQTKETTRCKWDAFKYRSHISPSCFIRHPVHLNEKPIVHEVDLEHLANAMKNRLNLFFPYIHELRVRYGGTTDDEITETIISDVNMMVDTAMSVAYNRLRFILQGHEPTACVTRMNPKSPLSNKFKFPAFISSVLGSIGPLHVTDFADTLVVYATSADRSQMYGRAQHFDFKCGHFLRLINNLEAIGVPLAQIDVKGGGIRAGSFFPTLLLNREGGLWDFTATCHYSNYKHRDIASAWLTLNDDPALRAFPDCSLRIECCTDPDVMNAVIASRPEGVPNDVDGATAPACPIGLNFNVNAFGVRPAVAAEGDNPAVPAAVYIVGRGTTRYFCTSLGRGLNEYDMISMLREYILRYDSSWKDKSF